MYPSSTDARDKQILSHAFGFYDDLTFNRVIIYALANRTPYTDGSQLFLTFDPNPHLDGLKRFLVMYTMV